MYESILAKRYARAFLNVFSEKISFEDIQNIEKLADFFHLHRQAFFYIKLSCIKASIKQEILNKLFERFKLHGLLTPLLDLLIKHKRLALITMTLPIISTLYKADHAIVDWTINSSQQLSADQLTTLQKFIESKTDQDVHFNFHLDKNLIAGIKAYSKDMLLEHSVEETLRKITTL